MGRRRYRLVVLTSAVVVFLLYHGFRSSSGLDAGPQAASLRFLTEGLTGDDGAFNPTPTRPHSIVQVGNPAVVAPPGIGGHSRDGYKPVTNNPPADAIHWERTPEFYPIAAKDLIALPSGDPISIPRIQFEFGPESPSDRATREKRLAAVKAEMLHAWKGYRAHGWMHDEIQPITGYTRDPFCGWAATLVDALDTLWITGLREEFDEAARAVANIDFTTTARDSIPVFETIIRYLGGLIAAYDVSGGKDGKYPILLEKAVELAEVLYGVFDTPNRLPVLYYRWKPLQASAAPRRAGQAAVAELGSMTMEFTRLAQLTGEKKWYDAAARITNALEDLQEGGRSKIPGIFPESLDASGCNTTALNIRVAAEKAAAEAAAEELEAARLAAAAAEEGEEAPAEGVLAEDDKSALRKRTPLPPPIPSSRSKGGTSVLPECIPQELIPSSWNMQSFSMGAAQDSTYEYFPKQYLLLGGLEPKYKKMHIKVVDAIKEHLLYRPMIPDESRDLRFSAKVELGREPADRRIKYEATHLTCFLGGMFGMGGRIFDNPEDIEIGKKITDGCVWAYESMNAGIMSEASMLVPCPKDSMLPGGQCAWNETEWHHGLDPQWATREDKIVQWELRRKQVVHENSNRADFSPAKAADPGLESRAPRTIVDPKPVSHADFVNGKLKTKALPPGFVSVEPRYYILRPEAIESVWYMYRITGDPVWMDKGWKMFESIIAATRTKYGHSALDDVTKEVPIQNNSMESFWMAETLKYFYLLYARPDVISLDDWVFNTEAHPFRRPTARS